MTWSTYEVMQAFFAGEIGDVEFTELMLENGEPLSKINQCLEEAREDS